MEFSYLSSDMHILEFHSLKREKLLEEKNVNTMGYKQENKLAFTAAKYEHQI